MWVNVMFYCRGDAGIRAVKCRSSVRVQHASVSSFPYSLCDNRRTVLRRVPTVLVAHCPYYRIRSTAISVSIAM